VVPFQFPREKPRVQYRAADKLLDIYIEKFAQHVTVRRGCTARMVMAGDDDVIWYWLFFFSHSTEECKAAKRIYFQHANAYYYDYVNTGPRSSEPDEANDYRQFLVVTGGQNERPDFPQLRRMGEWTDPNRLTDARLDAYLSCCRLLLKKYESVSREAPDEVDKFILERTACPLDSYFFSSCQEVKPVIEGDRVKHYEFKRGEDEKKIQR